MKHPEIRGLSDWRPLARGGLAVVWQARQQPLDRLVAVKVYQPEWDEGYRRWFIREAIAAGRLSGLPGVVTVYDLGILPDGRPFVIMELCPGGSMSQLLKRENPLNEERVRQLGLQLSGALAAVHARGVMHADIKPSNILIDRHGNPRLADFGLAVGTGIGEPEATALRLTPAYAPPEAFWTHRASEAGDVFSLAATLYALLAGVPPRGVCATPVTLEQMVELLLIPIGRIPGVRWDLMGVLMSALTNESADRPTAAQFSEELANVPAAPRLGTQLPRVAVPASVALEPARTPRALVSAESPSRYVASPAASAGPHQRADQVPSARPRQPNRPPERVLALASAALVTMVACSTAWLIGDLGPTSASSVGVSSSERTSRLTDPDLPTSNGTTAPDRTTSGAAARKSIRLKTMAESAQPWETVAIRGTYDGGADTLLRVQRWEAGKWTSFPLPAKTDESGHFSAYVELARPSRYRLRVLDPKDGEKSGSFLLEIRG